MAILPVGEAEKRQNKREIVCGNVVVSEQRNKIKMGRQRAVGNGKDKENIKITWEVNK